MGGALRDDTKNGCVADYQKLECLKFITYEVVALSVASRPKTNAPLATKPLRSTCKWQYVACVSKNFRKCC